MLIFSDNGDGVGLYDVVVGNEKFLVECGISVDKEIKDVSTSHEEKGRTVTLIGINGMYRNWPLDVITKV